MATLGCVLQPLRGCVVIELLPRVAAEGNPGLCSATPSGLKLNTQHSALSTSHSPGQNSPTALDLSSLSLLAPAPADRGQKSPVSQLPITMNKALSCRSPTCTTPSPARCAAVANVSRRARSLAIRYVEATQKPRDSWATDSLNRRSLATSWIT